MIGKGFHTVKLMRSSVSWWPEPCQTSARTGSLVEICLPCRIGLVYCCDNYFDILEVGLAATDRNSRKKF